jgi:two-component system phosphate regulon sensor histidine kinase PhoR
VKNSRFPWRIFLRFFFPFTGLPTLIVLLFKDQSWATFGVLVSTSAVALWSAWSVFRPFGRLVEKAQLHLNYREIHEIEDIENAFDRVRMDLKQRENALDRERSEIELVLSAIPLPLVAFDRESRVLFFNSEFAVHFSQATHSTSQSKLIEIFRNPDLLEYLMLGVTESQRSARVFSLRSQTGGNQERIFQVSVTPLSQRQGKVYGAVAIFADITEIKQAETMRIDFVANVSHELRTPLTSIKGYGELLQNELNQESLDSSGVQVLRRSVDAISRNVVRLTALVEDLLDLSSLEGGAELQKEWISAGQITQRVLSQFERLKVEKRIVVEEDSGDVRVLADPKRLEQVLTNLLDNAFKYIPAQSHIAVRWSDEGQRVRLRIRDDGPGIPPEAIPRLFERFFRVDKARARDAGGTGLGLAIVKHIVQKHGGQVGVQSVIGQGTEFTCEFTK